jgi:hypothetical protein
MRPSGEELDAFLDERRAEQIVAEPFERRSSARTVRPAWRSKSAARACHGEGAFSAVVSGCRPPG